LLFPELFGKRDRWMDRCFGLGSELHGGFMQEAIALRAVAALTGCYTVVPGMDPPLERGQDVIERERLVLPQYWQVWLSRRKTSRRLTGGTFQCLPGLPLVKRMCSEIWSTTLGDRTSHCWVLLKSSASA
jgi:hypothetical protein